MSKNVTRRTREWRSSVALCVYTQTSDPNEPSSPTVEASLPQWFLLRRAEKSEHPVWWSQMGREERSRSYHIPQWFPTSDETGPRRDLFGKRRIKSATKSSYRSYVPTLRALPGSWNRYRVSCWLDRCSPLSPGEGHVSGPSQVGR